MPVAARVETVPTLAAVAALALATIAAGCGDPRSVLVARPSDPAADRAVTALWSHEIHGVARDGDWILSRSYFAAGDAIALATPGEDLSHASIYDAARGTVIEAVAGGVRELPLAQLVARNHYLIVVRPTRMTAADQAAALGRARRMVGAPFDTAGLVGLDDPSRFYCSELVYWASQTAARHGRAERVITPADLMRYGEVIYWSGARTDAQLLALAQARAARAAPARTAAR